MTVTLADIRSAIQRLGVSGRPLCLHSSLRSFGVVEGGASTVVKGFLVEGCTLMVPSFSWSFAVPPPPDDRPQRNGWNYVAYPGPTAGIGRLFTPSTLEVDRDMGAIPVAVVALPGRVRGNHPLCSFTAAGPLAGELIAGQCGDDVYAPLRALALLHGFVILIGVGLTSMTLIHLSEQMAGRKLFRRWANTSAGHPMGVETGACSDGFGNLDPVVAPLMRDTMVGCSLWRVFPAQETVEAVAQAIRQTPGITHCANAHCVRCNDAVLGGPIKG